MSTRDSEENTTAPPDDERTLAYRVLRYAPNLVRDEWVNIGVLLFDPQSGERRLRLMEETAEFSRVRRLHPQADEELLRALRDDLEDRFQQFSRGALAEPSAASAADWQQLVAKWDDTLANAIQLAPQKGVRARDLDSEMERLYADHVAPQAIAQRVGAPGSRATLRNYCSQVFRQAHVWKQLEKSVRVSNYTFPGDPMRIDYRYQRNGTRGYVQTLSVTRSPADAKLFAYTAERIAAKSEQGTEFAAITDVKLQAKNERHEFVAKTLRSAGIEPVPLERFAVWVSDLKPHLGVH